MKQFISKWVKMTLSTVFFAGFIPLMPGTIGSLLAAGALFAVHTDIRAYNTPDYAIPLWFGMLALITLCVSVCNGVGQFFHREDPPQVILDEVVGQLVTFFLIPLTWRTILLGFIYFRFFDIVKPFAVHRFEELDDGLGITMDDVVAGICANVSLALTIWIYHAMRSLL